MKIRYFLLLLILGSFILCTGCMHVVNGEDLYFSYREAPFRAELRGTLDGIPFSAEIGRDSPIDPNDPRIDVYIKYLTPHAMQDVRLYYDSKSDLYATLEDILYPIDDDTTLGWLRPLELLFSDGELLSIIKEGETFILQLPQGELRLSKDGLPLSARGEQFMFDVIWWESEKP